MNKLGSTSLYVIKVENETHYFIDNRLELDPLGCRYLHFIDEKVQENRKGIKDYKEVSSLDNYINYIDILNLKWIASYKDKVLYTDKYNFYPIKEPFYRYISIEKNVFIIPKYFVTPIKDEYIEYKYKGNELIIINKYWNLSIFPSILSIINSAYYISLYKTLIKGDLNYNEVLKIRPIGLVSIYEGKGNYKREVLSIIEYISKQETLICITRFKHLDSRVKYIFKDIEIDQINDDSLALEYYKELIRRNIQSLKYKSTDSIYIDNDIYLYNPEEENPDKYVYLLKR
jgi:hypothetical protein